MRLPSELLFHIASFLSHSSNDLAALATVSSSWSPVALSLLYLHVNIRTHPAPLLSLANNPRLALLVRSFAVSYNDNALHPLLLRALANMSNLLELDLFLDPDFILRISTSFPLLHRFATSLPWSPFLVHFLHNCPHISRLYLDHSSPFPDLNLPLPQDFLPALSHFTGPPSIALLLIPHRPVQHIDLTSTPILDLTPSLALSLSQSSAPVLALAATASSTARPHPHQDQDHNLVTVLTVLARCMRHLRHLRVVTNTYADASTFLATGPFSDSYFEHITDALASLPDLQSCEIWGFHWVSSKKNKPAPTTTWHSPSFTNSATTTNDLDVLYQDLIFPY